MAAIRISRPKQEWSVSPATMLPAGLLLRLVKPRWNFTVLLDGRAVGVIGREQVKVFHADRGEHRLRVRFVLVRRSAELRLSLEGNEERSFICGANGLGWPTLREATPEEVAESEAHTIDAPPSPGDPGSPG